MNPQTRADIKIRYEFQFQDGHRWQYEVYLEPNAQPAPKVTPEWAQLGFHQCDHCPLKAADSPSCPFAAALLEPVSALAQHPSHEEVEVTVTWRGREIRQRTSLQRATGSLLGALGATSGCPYTDKLRAMAWFHWPFSTSDESIYRVLGTYLLGQHLRQQKGLQPDWSLEGLREIYRNIRQVNRGMSERLRAAADEDSSLNGLVLLDLLAADTLYSLEQYDGELDKYFEDYFF